MSEDTIQRLLGEIVANQRAMVAEQKRINVMLLQHFDDDKESFGGLGKRLQKLEQKINYAGGAIAVCTGVVIMFWETIFKA